VANGPNIFQMLLVPHADDCVNRPMIIGITPLKSAILTIGVSHDRAGE